MKRYALTNQSGFTLIELMIVVVILGIITTIAVTTFGGASQDSERTKMISELVSLNDAMGRYYQGAFTYEGATVSALRNDMINATESYDVTLENLTATTYVIAARPKVGEKMEGTGTYGINELGQRCRFDGTPATDALPVTTCEQRW